VELVEQDIRDVAIDSGDTFKSMFATSLTFSWMVTQEQLVAGLITGLVMCFPIVFLVLLTTTANLILATYATFTIFAVVCSVLGCAQWIGWMLGTAETIATTIVSISCVCMYVCM